MYNNSNLAWNYLLHTTIFYPTNLLIIYNKTEVRHVYCIQEKSENKKYQNKLSSHNKLVVSHPCSSTTTGHIPYFPITACLCISLSLSLSLSCSLSLCLCVLLHPLSRSLPLSLSLSLSIILSISLSLSVSLSMPLSIIVSLPPSHNPFCP